MEYKAGGLYEEARSMQSHIDDIQRRQRAEALLEELEPLNLTKDALVIRKGVKAQALPHDALLRLEMFGEMSLHIKAGEIYELQTFGVGRALNRDVSFVSKFVLPQPDKILALSEGGNILISKGERAPLFDKLVWEDGKYGGRRMVRLLKDIINEGKSKDIKILKSYEDNFGGIFASSVRVEDILDRDRKWEIVSAPYSVAYTEHYSERVRDAGLPVLDVHTHSVRIDPPASTLDAWDYAGPKKDVEWAGILHVVKHPVFSAGPAPQIIGYAAPHDFKFTPESFSAYYSSMEDVEWLRKAVSELSKDSLRSRLMRGIERFPMSNSKVVRDFEKAHTARVMTYEQLLEEAG
jgi:hypothetical protein